MNLNYIYVLKREKVIINNYYSYTLIILLELHF